jgi:hypothetical protein
MGSPTDTNIEEAEVTMEVQANQTKKTEEKGGGSSSKRKRSSEFQTGLKDIL